MTEAIHTSSVLVLNRHWQAIDVKTPAQAFAMMATGSARRWIFRRTRCCPSRGPTG